MHEDSVKISSRIAYELQSLDAEDIKVIKAKVNSCLSLDSRQQKLFLDIERGLQITKLSEENGSLTKIKMLADGCVCERISERKRLVARSRRKSVSAHSIIAEMAVMVEDSEKEAQKVFEERAAEISEAGKKEVVSLLKRRPFSSKNKEKNVRTAIIAGAVVGGIVIAGSIMGAGGGVAAGAFLAANAPVVMQAFQFAGDVASHISQWGPAALDAFYNVTEAALTVSADLGARAGETFRASVEFANNTISPVASWISTQRAEIVQAVNSALELVSWAWNKAVEMGPVKLAGYAMAGLGALKAGHETISWAANMLKTVFFRKEKPKSDGKAATHNHTHIHHHHHHYHGPSDPSSCKLEAESGAESDVENEHQNDENSFDAS